MNRADVLELAEVKRMAQAALSAGQTRDALLIGLGTALGLRITDLLRLHWRDLLDERGQLREWVDVFERKNKSRRVVRTPKWLGPIIEAHFRTIGGLPDLESRIFAISRQRAWVILRKWAEAAGVRKRISPHSLRKCFCTTVYSLTRDPVLACTFTGHKNPAQLLRYIGYASPTVERIWAEYASMDWAYSVESTGGG